MTFFRKNSTVQQGQLDVFQRRRTSQQMKALKNIGETISAQRRDVVAADGGACFGDPTKDLDFAFIGYVEQTQHMQQRGFAAARGTNKSDEFAALDLKVHTAQGLHHSAVIATEAVGAGYISGSDDNAHGETFFSNNSGANDDDDDDDVAIVVGSEYAWWFAPAAAFAGLFSDHEGAFAELFALDLHAGASLGFDVDNHRASWACDCTRDALLALTAAAASFCFAFSGAGSISARSWPAVTSSLKSTSTLSNWPLTREPICTCVAGCNVPVASIETCSVPRSTFTVL